MIKKSGSAVTAPLLVAAVMLLLKISELLISSQLNNSENIYLVTIVIQVIVYILPCALYYQMREGKNSDPLLLRPVKPRQLLFVFFVLLMFITGIVFIDYLVYYLSGGVSADVSSGLIFPVQGDEINSSFAFVAFAVVPSVCEELFFRGVILNEYRKFGSFNAVILSSLCFSMFHFNLTNFPAYFFAGIVFGFVTVVCRSVYPAMLLHLINNFLSIYMSSSFIKLMVQESGLFFVGFVFFILFSIFLLIVLSRTESVYYQYSQNPPDDDLPPSSIKNIVTVYLSPSFFLLLGVFTLMVLLD
ncbi:MAG TPA: CPBP family intramembrane metalloprotease [Bacillota bacterium]|nr:CPBP family intramembrane metalloprotease [Bacillota bacterium]